MATNTLIQYLETERFSAFPGGASEGVPLDASNRRQTEVYRAGAALNSGDVVALDFSTGGLTDGQRGIQVVQSDHAVATSKMVVGIVLGPATPESDDGSGGVLSGGLAEVCVRGLCEANVLANVAAGNLLYITATAGSLDDAIAAAQPNASGAPVAIASEAGPGAPGQMTVFVLGKAS